MTSKNTSSPSLTTTRQDPINYEKLLGEPKKLRALVRVLGTDNWADLEQWFLAERQEHLELSVDSDDPGEREAHRVVAKWLKHFLTIAKDELRAADEALRHPEPEPVTDYMPFDSQIPVDGAPPGGLTKSPRGGILEDGKYYAE